MIEEEDKELPVTEEWLLNLMEELFGLRSTITTENSSKFCVVWIGELYIKVRSLLGSKGDLQDDYFRGEYKVKQVPIKAKEYAIKESVLKAIYDVMERLTYFIPANLIGQQPRLRRLALDYSSQIKGWLQESGKIDKPYKNI